MPPTQSIDLEVVPVDREHPSSTEPLCGGNERCVRQIHRRIRKQLHELERSRQCTSVKEPHRTLRWTAALARHPRVKMLSNLEPGQAWALATARFEGLDSRALERYTFDRHGIVVAAEYSQGLPGPVFDYEGRRVTPGVTRRPSRLIRSYRPWEACSETVCPDLADWHRQGGPPGLA